MKTDQRLALLKACRIVGGQKQLAAMIEVRPSRLCRWVNRNKGNIPYWYAFEIERVTQGQVTCAELISEWENKKEKYFKNMEEYLKRNKRYNV